jgi:hypothetical protein
MFELSISYESINSMSIWVNKWCSSDNSCGWISWVPVSKEFMGYAIGNDKNAENKEKLNKFHIKNDYKYKVPTL